MKAAAWGALVVGAVLVVAALTCWVAAIWVIGPDSMRLGGTGLLLLIVGGVITVAAGTWLGDNS